MFIFLGVFCCLLSLLGIFYYGFPCVLLLIFSALLFEELYKLKKITIELQKKIDEIEKDGK